MTENNKLNNQIDKTLAYIYEQNLNSKLPNDTDIKFGVGTNLAGDPLPTNIMVLLNLIKTHETDKNLYQITDLGLTAYSMGGWSVYSKLQVDKVTLEYSALKTSELTNKSVMLTNKIQWAAAGLTIAIIFFSAYTDRQALSISRRDHYLEHIKLQQQQSQKEQYELKRLHRHNPANDPKTAKTDTLKSKSKHP